MARKSRRVVAAPAASSIAATIIYKTAIYARLSIEDTRDRKDSESLTNQQELIRQYILERPELELCSVFLDNGETGTNFHRPGWNRLLDECRSGQINCIVAKDLSRLGRNYLETGEYLEKVFPLLGVRVIAIGDSYDSLTLTDGKRLVSNLKNLVNDIYAKDISRKSSSALRQKQKNGDFIGSYAPYGYLKTAEDKNRIVVDEETAPIVRDIFRWKAEGVSHTRICRKLNEAGIPAPCKYRYQKGILKNERYADIQWAPATLKTILRNPVYLGHMAQGKNNGALYECRGGRPQRSEWVVVENTHTAIVDADTFAKAQAVMESRHREYKAREGRYDYFQPPDNILKGLVYCADCGKPLYRYKSVTGKGKYVTYVFLCRTYTQLMEAGCTKKSIHETELVSAVHALLQAEIAKATDMGRIVERLNSGAKSKSRMGNLEQEAVDLDARLRRISGLRRSVYEDYVGGLLTEEEYRFAMGKYDADTLDLQRQLEEINRLREHHRQSFTPANKWLAAFQRFEIEEELTTEMVRALIERIEVTSDNRITVVCKYMDEQAALLGYINKNGEAMGA